jgi:hypothetical protein
MAQVKPKSPAAKSPAKPEDLWHEARLLPTTSIGGQADQEQRATSALLAVLRGVPEFGRALLSQAGAPAGRIRTYIEVQVPDDIGKVPRPDGAVIVEWGKKRWIALLEVKTGGVPLVADQVNAYLDIAHVRGYDAALTISNQSHFSSQRRSSTSSIKPARPSSLNRPPICSRSPGLSLVPALLS